MPEKVVAWKGRKEVPLSHWGVRFLLFVYRLLGRRAARWLTALVLLPCYPFLRAARRASADYRKRWAAHTGGCFPGGGFRHILHFCFAMLDRLACWGGTFPAESIQNRTPGDVEVLTKDFRAGRGAFFIIAHMGNAQLLRAVFLPLARKYGRRIQVYLDIEPSKNFNAMASSINRESAMSLHSTHELGVGASIELAGAVERGDLVFMAGDRISREDARACYRHDFLGSPVPYPRGTFRLAAALGCPVYTMFLLADGLRYDLYTERLSDGSARADDMCREFVARLEKRCIRYPQEWFNFYPYWG